jgi:hypothetical protein
MNKETGLTFCLTDLSLLFWPINRIPSDRHYWFLFCRSKIRSEYLLFWLRISWNFSPYRNVVCHCNEIGNYHLYTTFIHHSAFSSHSPMSYILYSHETKANKWLIRETIWHEACSELQISNSVSQEIPVLVWNPEIVTNTRHLFMR